MTPQNEAEFAACKIFRPWLSSAQDLTNICLSWKGFPRRFSEPEHILGITEERKGHLTPSISFLSGIFDSRDFSLDFWILEIMNWIFGFLPDFFWIFRRVYEDFLSEMPLA